MTQKLDSYEQTLNAAHQQESHIESISLVDLLKVLIIGVIGSAIVLLGILEDDIIVYTLGIIIMGMLLAYGVRQFIINVLNLIWQLKDRARINGRSMY